MRFAYFPGCKIARHQPAYDRSTRAVMDALGVRLLDLPFNCCGYPIRHENFIASVFSAARNMALARARHQTILTPCKCCYGNLKHAQFWLDENPELRTEVNGLLAEEGLEWIPGLRVVHLLTALIEDIGPARIRARVRNPLEGLTVAAHYGCHALRPSEVTRFDDPLAPTIFETLVELTGARTVDWPLRLECCGHPLRGKNDRLSLRLMDRKLRDAAESGADVLATACTYCQIQFDTVRAEAEANGGSHPGPPAILYPQLLGLSMGLSREALGLDENGVVPSEDFQSIKSPVS